MSRPTLRTTTGYLAVSLEGARDEIEVEISYYFVPATEDTEAEVELSSIVGRHTDVLKLLPEPMRLKVAAQILRDELAGVYA